MQDLQEIWAYIANDNLQKANEFIVALKEKIIFLGHFPNIGISKDNIVENLKKIVYGNYLIWYFERETIIEIYRVTHGARDVRNLI